MNFDKPSLHEKKRSYNIDMNSSTSVKTHPDEFNSIIMDNGNE